MNDVSDTLSIISKRYCDFIHSLILKYCPRREQYIQLLSFLVGAAGAIAGYEQTAICLLTSESSMSKNNYDIINDDDRNIVNMNNLNNNNNNQPIGPNIWSLVTHSLGIGVGALVSLPFADLLGRRFTLTAAAASHVLFSFYTWRIADMSNIFSSRIFVNISLGAMMTAAPIYLSEISLGIERGQSCAALYFCTCIGSLLACIFHLPVSLVGVTFDEAKSYPDDDHGIPFAIGLYLTAPIIISLIMSLLLPAIPESPRWLLAHRTPQEALESMRILRKANDAEVQGEFSDIYMALASDAREEDSWWDLFTNQSLRYRVFLTFMLPLCHELAGAQIGRIQMITLISAVHAGLYLEMIASSFAAVMSAYVCYRYIDLWGRQNLMLVGTLGTAITWLLAAWCVHGINRQRVHHLHGNLDSTTEVNNSSSVIVSQDYHSTSSNSNDNNSDGEQPLSLVMMFVVAMFIVQASFLRSGIDAPMSIIPTEIYPLRARSRGVALHVMLKALVGLLTAGVFNVWQNFNIITSQTPIGDSTDDANIDDTSNDNSSGDSNQLISTTAIPKLFIFLSTCSALVALFIFFGVPETAGIMLEDADDLFFWSDNDAMIPFLTWLPCSIERSCIGRRRFLIQDRHGVDENQESVHLNSAFGYDTFIPLVDHDHHNYEGSNSDNDNTLLCSQYGASIVGTTSYGSEGNRGDPTTSLHKYSMKLNQLDFVYGSDNEYDEISWSNDDNDKKGSDFFRPGLL